MTRHIPKSDATTLRRRTLTAAVLAMALASAAGQASAQQEPARIPTGVISGSIHGLVSVPRGDFGKNVGTGGGLGVSGLVRLDKSSIFNIRADAGVLTYGNTTRRIPLAGTGGLVKLDLKTSNNIASFLVGPQLLGTNGSFSPYAALLGGFSVFWTESSVEGSSNTDEPFASTTNHHDAVLAYGGAAGMYIRVHNGTRPVRLDFGARFLRHDDVRYLNDARVREAFENDRDPLPMRGRADFTTYYAGVNVVLW